MPMALEHIRNMDDNTNMFNPKYFKVFFKKTIFLNSQRAGSVHPTDNWQTEGQTTRDDDVIVEEDPEPSGDGAAAPDTPGGATSTTVPPHPSTNAQQSEYLRSQTTGAGTTSNIRRFGFTVKPKSAKVNSVANDPGTSNTTTPRTSVARNRRSRAQPGSRPNNGEQRPRKLFSGRPVPR